MELGFALRQTSSRNSLLSLCSPGVAVQTDEVDEWADQGSEPSSLNEPEAPWDEAVGLASVLVQRKLCALWALSGCRSVDGGEGHKVPLALGDGEAHACDHCQALQVSSRDEGDGRFS